mmetsp:Transcript_21243/g.44360  ORF Transcript_21243/g.44360 Transcript_21243/m.44360 type:complete len:350 (-) Transcript_21243:134-1183(-)
MMAMGYKVVRGVDTKNTLGVIESCPRDVMSPVKQMIRSAASSTARLGWNRLYPSIGNFANDPENARIVSAMPQDLRGFLQRDPSPRTDLATYYQTLSASSKWFNEYVVSQMKTKSGEAAYTPDVLKIYDSGVWGHNSPFHWRIHQNEVQSMYNHCLRESQSHCEIAVGTGLFLSNLDQKQCSKLKRIALLDLQPSALEACQSRLALNECYRKNHVQLESHLANILEEPSNQLQGAFNSVAANFLVHCLPPGDDPIFNTFQNCASLLQPSSPRAVFFGTTVLGADLIYDQQHAGPVAVDPIHAYNQAGIFGNQHHSFHIISEALRNSFDDVQIWRIGYCAAWMAKDPKAK